MIDLHVVTKADIEQALNGDYHQLLQSCPATGPDLVYQGERYPAVAVLGVSYLINQGLTVSREASSRFGVQLGHDEAGRTLLQNLGFKVIDHAGEDEFPGAEGYQLFFDMLKFWITQTDNNINDTHKVRFKEIKENNAERAAGVFTDPQFYPEYLDYKKFRIRISFFRSGRYKGDKVNFIVFQPDEINPSWWLNIRYSYDTQQVIASYRSDIEANSDTPEFRAYMTSFGYQKGLSFDVAELDLAAEAPNSQVKQFFDYFYDMIKRGGEFKRSGISMQGQALEAMLKQSYNIILRGAPGTGKTFLAQQIAASMITDGRTVDIDKLTAEESKQLGFVQFHPSYDYTDFVEGLRPTNSGSDVGFELVPGIFKAFCERAGKSTVNAVDNFEASWSQFAEQMNEAEEIEVAPGYVFHPSKSWESKGGIMRTTAKYNQYINKNQLYSLYRGVLPGSQDNFSKKILQYMKAELGLQDFRAGEGINEKPYIFIIDEINRGEISKIFGELFFSLDPGYRGPKGGVLTQYANLHEDRDEKFFIPENVYIIGTMNDIDRSVDTFDFAMRRRFTFVEITAAQSAANMLQANDTKALMTRLNQAVVDKDTGGLTREYEIGASYFLPIDGAGIANSVIDPLWRNKLEPLLSEYFRGEHDAAEKVGKLRKAYFGVQEED